MLFSSCSMGHNGSFHLPSKPRDYTLTRSDNNVVNWNKNQLHKKPDESHHNKSDSRAERNLREFFAIWFVTSLDEANTVFRELSQWIEDRI